MGKSVFGEVRWGVHRQQVEARREWGGWRGRVVSQVPRDADRAILLVPGGTLLVEGGGTRPAREQRLARCLRGPLVGSPVRSRRDGDSVILASREALRDLPAGASGVPLSLALAALSELVVPRRPVAIYFGFGAHRELVFAERGIPVSRRRLPSGWVEGFAITPPDECAQKTLTRDAVRLRPWPDLFGTLSPLAILAVGVALAWRRPGSFPPLPQRGFARVSGARRGLPWVALALVVSGWAVAESQVIALEKRREALARQLEQVAWEERSRQVVGRQMLGPGVIALRGAGREAPAQSARP